jgi:hypothetical protein
VPSTIAKVDLKKVSKVEVDLTGVKVNGGKLQ